MGNQEKAPQEHKQDDIENLSLDEIVDRIEKLGNEDVTLSGAQHELIGDDDRISDPERMDELAKRGKEVGKEQKKYLNEFKRRTGKDYFFKD